MSATQWRLETVDCRAREFDSRADAEAAKADMESMGVEVELLPPQRDGSETEEDQVEPTVDQLEHLPERSVADVPIEWIPRNFVDTIEGEPAINRKGYSVLAHFYNIETRSDVQVAPEETDFEFCRVKATSVTEDGTVYEAHGSAHVDRGDDRTILLELADTRAKKRALSLATGVGAVAVAELKNEIAATGGD